MVTDRLLKGLWAGLALAILALQVRLWSGEGSFSQVWNLDDQIESQRAINDNLAERNRALAAEVMELRLAQSALEERARVQLGMVHQDETFYLIPGQ
jgi:cell division protein FtsB